MRIIAIDWSGARKGSQKKIWLSEVRDGKITRLESGRDRDQVAAHLIEEADREPQTVIGLDFAFSFPAWYLNQLAVPSAAALWERPDNKAEDLLAACAPPLWGRPGRGKPADLPTHFRRTELMAQNVGGITPKSTFQIGGAGAVGTGSIRGMRLLHRLHNADFSVWPFDPPGWPLVVEIYPRVLTGEVKKSNPLACREYLDRRYPLLPADVRSRAAVSEDAFDAAVSSLVMWEHRHALASLPRTVDPEIQLEGWIWDPAVHMPAGAAGRAAG